MRTIHRPDPGDYPAYYGAYVHAADGKDLAEALDLASVAEAATKNLVPGHMWEHRYAPGKWTIKEVFQHIADTERVFAYRAFCIARNEQADLPYMDEDAYQREARSAARSIDDIMRELRAVRQATIALFDGLDEQALRRKGKASGKAIGAAALGWIIAGHSQHHLRLVRERYLA